MASLAVDAAVGGKHMTMFDIEEECSVIYLDEDTATDDYEERLDRFAVNKLGVPRDELPIDCSSNEGFRLHNHRHRNKLVDDVKRLKSKGKPVLVLLDCLTKIMAGKKMTSIDEGTDVMNYLADIRNAGATVIVTHHISIHKEVKAKMFNPINLAMGSTQLVGGSDTGFAVIKVPLEGMTFAIIPQPRRIGISRKGFGVVLEEDSDKNWARLVATDEIPHLPSDNANKVFGMFVDATTELSINDLEKKLSGDLKNPQIRDGVSELVREKCLKRMIDPHSSSHAAWYTLHPDLNSLDTYYKNNITV